MPWNNNLNDRFLFLNVDKFHRSVVISLSTFFVAFLLIFLPFGVNEPKKNYNLEFFLVMSSFGILIFLVLFINEKFLRKRLVKLWTVRTLIAWFLWIFLIIGTVSFLIYNYLQNWADMKWLSYLSHFINVTSMEIIPTIGVFAYYRYKELQLDLKKIKEERSENDILSHFVVLQGDSSKEVIRLKISQILYFKADDNYVTLYYLENDQVKKHTFRSTLSKFEKMDTIIPFIMRIHRSFLVNKFKIKKTKGTKSKLMVVLNNFEEKLPVSRKYTNTVIAYLEK